MELPIRKSIELSITEGYFTEESQKLLQLKSDNKQEGWGQSLLEVLHVSIKERRRNYLIALLLILSGVVVLGLSILVKYIVFKSGNDGILSNCIESSTSFDGWKFRQVCLRCSANLVAYGGQCIRFLS